MSELWVPRPDKTPDVTNIFDMMLVFQEQIDDPSNFGKQEHLGQLAVNALAVALQRMGSENRTLSVVTELAVIDGHQERTVTFAKNVGLYGDIVDIHCIEISDHLPLSVTLDMDVENVFMPGNPEDSDLLMSYVRTPINRVKYIETIAA